MTEFVRPPNPQETQNHLLTLQEEVNNWTGGLDAGKSVSLGAADIQLYRSAKIKFSNPLANLEPLTPTLFEQVGIQLSPLHAEQMRHRFDFYHMTLSVQMRPEPGTYFRALGCQLNFGMDTAGEPIVVSIFPDEQWQEVYKFGGSLQLNLDGNLGFEVGIEGLDTAVAQSTLPAHLQSKLINKNEMNSFIQIPAFAYSRGRFNIAAYGPDGSECYWYLDNDEISQTLTAQFTIVFKVPKGSKAISLKGVAWAEPDMNKLTANFRPVITRFQNSLRDLFSGANKGAREFAVTVGETWDEIGLPTAVSPPSEPTPQPAADEIETAPLSFLPRASQMGKLLTQWFSEADLRTLCLDIGYDYENLPGRSKPEYAQELALLTLRENTFDKLRDYCQQKRPHVDWNV